MLINAITMKLQAYFKGSHITGMKENLIIKKTCGFTLQQPQENVYEKQILVFNRQLS